MRIIICDDDLLILNQLKEYIKVYFEQNKLKCPEIVIYNNGEDLLSDEQDKDMVFLDIEMPGLSGIFVGNELKKANENIIIFIVTSYNEYLDDAMRFHVFRYLSKPLDKQRLYRNIKDALQLYNTANAKISIETNSTTYAVSASDIISVEACARKVTIHTLKQDYNSIHNMQYWITALDMPCFFLSHRSFIVNLKHVSSFDHSMIHLCDGRFEAYLTRRKYSKFKDAYLLYLESIR